MTNTNMTNISSSSSSVGVFATKEKIAANKIIKKTVKVAKHKPSSSNKLNHTQNPQKHDSNNGNNINDNDENTIKNNDKNAAQAVFAKLDPVEFQHRIEQRRRAIQHGKNTSGYEEYIKQVPKEKRRPRSMKHPNTPDHTLDIPTKRWQGLVKAWYVNTDIKIVSLCVCASVVIVSQKCVPTIHCPLSTHFAIPPLDIFFLSIWSRRKALHQYDPPDLTMAFAQEAESNPSDQPRINSSIKDLEMEAAHKQGLLVDLRQPINESSPTSAACNFSSRADLLLDQWESKTNDDNLEDVEHLLDDSDDDLL